jgi:hypothetical protein
MLKCHDFGFRRAWKLEEFFATVTISHIHQQQGKIIWAFQCTHSNSFPPAVLNSLWMCLCCVPAVTNFELILTFIMDIVRSHHFQSQDEPRHRILTRIHGKGRWLLIHLAWWDNELLLLCLCTLSIGLEAGLVGRSWNLLLRLFCEWIGISMADQNIAFPALEDCVWLEKTDHQHTVAIILYPANNVGTTKCNGTTD